MTVYQLRPVGQRSCPNQTTKETQMYDVMLDLKTMGTRPGCAILSVGAVAFSPNGEDVTRDDSGFYENVELQSCLDLGLTIDQTTLYWWMKQSPEARAAWMTPPHHPVLEVISWFSKWFTQFPTQTKIWSHGASFDIPVLDAVYGRMSKMSVPWNYQAVRDTRTLFDLTSVRMSDVPNTGVKHHALDDAIHQARVVQFAYRKLRGTGLSLSS
jgi:hypothetical protein